MGFVDKTPSKFVHHLFNISEPEWIQALAMPGPGKLVQLDSKYVAWKSSFNYSIIAVVFIHFLFLFVFSFPMSFHTIKHGN